MNTDCIYKPLIWLYKQMDVVWTNSKPAEYHRTRAGFAVSTERKCVSDEVHQVIWNTEHLAPFQSTYVFFNYVKNVGRLYHSVCCDPHLEKDGLQRSLR